MAVLVVLGLSILAQFAAAMLAVRLIRVTGRQLAWILLTAAILFMALRRITSFIEIWNQPFPPHNLHLMSEFVAFFISLLMLAGIATIGPIFRELQESRDALRESALRQRAILNNIPDLAWLKDKESRFIAVNTPFAKACGVVSEDVVGKGDLHIWPRDLALHYREDDHEVMQTKKRKLIEERLVDSAGNEHWIETIKTPIINDDGEVIGTTGIARDITERKKVQDALGASEEAYRTTIDSLSDLIHVVNSDLKIILFNSAFTRQNKQLGLDTEMMGRTIFDAFPFLQEKARDEYQWVFDNKRTLVTEESVEIGEKHFIMEIRKIPIVEDVKAERVVTFIRDVTEKRMAEKEREQLIAKLEAQNLELERFTYTVSHDLRSPLVTIRGFLGFLEQDVVNGKMERLREDVQRILEATDTMEHLLKDLLELSRVGRVVNPFQQVSFGEVVSEAARLVSGNITERGVEILIAPNLPTAYGDRPRLVEVLQNLIENAVKFMGDQGRPQVEIGATRCDEQNVYYVRDNGIGIDPLYHEKVFGLFERLEESVEGTGVGLALVRRIVELHGGSIWVESQGIGHGSTFCFTLGPPTVKTSMIEESK